MSEGYIFSPMERIASFAGLLWIFVVLGPALHAQDYTDEAFSVGSYDRVTKDVRFVNDGILWTVTDMDDGTSFILLKEPQLLSVAKDNGVVFITGGSVRDENSSLLLIGSLPIKIPSGAKVQFTCDRGKFIYLYNRKR
jgi:hypothetical protein